MIEAPGFEPFGACGDGMSACSVCSRCDGMTCSSPAGSDCTSHDDCGLASYCTPGNLCEPRRSDFECCEADPQCLSADCKDGACQPEPYICSMPFPSPLFTFPPPP